MKKILIFPLVLCLILNLNFMAFGIEKIVSSECDVSDIEVPIDATTVNAAIGQTLDIKAKSVILMEVNTGEILYESNSDEKLAPASITKIMPLLLVMEAIDRGEISLETVVTASEHACSMGGSQIWLEPGESMTVDELLKATVIASANDACVALGELISGSEEGFVALMNERAKELGMNNTTFVNCTGLDADGHLTSAHDVAIMSTELIKHKLIKNYSTVWMDSLRNGQSELVNTNKLVRFYEGTTGLKTGTTGIAKYCLSATAERNDMELCAVVMAGETSNDRFAGAKKLLDYGFANYSFSVLESEFKQGQVEIKGGTKKNVKIQANGTINHLMQKNSASEITRKTEWNENLQAPINKGDVLGYVNIFSGENQIGSIPITASEKVKKLSIFVAMGEIFAKIFKL